MKRSECRKVLVWDNYSGEKQKRILLFENSDGSCLCVEQNHEDSFINNGVFTTCIWKHWKEIPNPKMRPMTRNEVLKFVLNNHHKLLIRVNNHSWSPALTLYYLADLSNYEYIFICELDNNERPKKFEVEVTE